MGLTFTGNEWRCSMRMAPRVPLGKHRALADCRATIGVYGVARKELGGDVSRPPMVPPEEEQVPAEVGYDADLSGQVFMFSGFRGEVLAARIGNAGGTMKSGISRMVTTPLVLDASAPPSGKVKKAIEYGIAVRSRAEVEVEFYL